MLIYIKEAWIKELNDKKKISKYYELIDERRNVKANLGMLEVLYKKELDKLRCQF
jgi:hypothetical protein